MVKKSHQARIKSNLLLRMETVWLAAIYLYACLLT